MFVLCCHLLLPASLISYHSLSPHPAFILLLYVLYWIETIRRMMMEIMTILDAVWWWIISRRVPLLLVLFNVLMDLFIGIGFKSRVYEWDYFVLLFIYFNSNWDSWAVFSIYPPFFLDFSWRFWLSQKFNMQIAAIVFSLCKSWNLNYFLSWFRLRRMFRINCDRMNYYNLIFMAGR